MLSLVTPIAAVPIAVHIIAEYYFKACFAEVQCVREDGYPLPFYIYI